MGKLICDIAPHKGEVQVDAASFAKVQDAVQKHIAGAPVNRIYGVLAQGGTKWHITPQGPDWHISPNP